MDFTNKKICILGYGRSGKAAAERLFFAGAHVKVSESKPVGANGRLPVPPEGIEYESGGHTLGFCLDNDFIVVSPGIHLDIPVIEEAIKKGVPVISEIELASMFFSKPMIAITGTNGKTTTTTLTGEIFKKAGYRVAVAGNIGIPLVSVDDKDLDYIIAEISSYQLETIDRFSPHIAVMLNLTPDHMERYGTMEAYGKAKQRIFKNQTSGDFLVYNHDDVEVREMTKNAYSRKVPFSRKESVSGGPFVNGGYMVRLNENYLESIIKISAIRIKGDHNIENALAAVSTALLCKIPVSDIAAALKEFGGVEHRIEHVATINGVEFLNDSKATNPDSTIVALKAVGKGGDIILILGGRDKGTDLADMSALVKERTKAVILIGEAGPRFEKALRASGFGNIHYETTLENAVRRGFSLSSKGDKVLLSPACASFDMFEDYEHRGRVFKESVRKLKDAL